MSIFLSASSKVLVQGMTGSEGRKHSQLMIDAGTDVVAGVTPGKGGRTQAFDGSDPRPIFDTVHEAVEATGADVSCVFVPASRAEDAVRQAIDAQVRLVVVITEGIPVRDAVEFVAHARRSATTRVIGPNCPGLISPGACNVGIIPSSIARSGRIGLVSKSGTLTYQLMYELRDIGFSTCVGIGGDPVVGTSHIECLEAFEQDPQTEAICLIGEIGGDAEERAAAYISEHVTKPVVAYVAGFTAPEGRTMGHAGAIVSGSSGTAEAKKRAFLAAGVRVGDTPHETSVLMRDVLGNR